MRRGLIALAATITLTGCATHHGSQVSRSDFDQIIVGKTTKSEVINLLGEPNGSGTGSYQDGGTEWYSYVGASASASPANYLPYIGSLFGGIDTEGTSAHIYFDPEGVVTNTAYSNQKQALNTGLLNSRSSN